MRHRRIYGWVGAVLGSCILLSLGCLKPKAARTMVRTDITYADGFDLLHFEPLGERSAPTAGKTGIRIERTDGRITELSGSRTDEPGFRYQLQYTDGVPRRSSPFPVGNERPIMYQIFRPDTIFEVLVEFRALREARHPLDPVAFTFHRRDYAPQVAFVSWHSAEGYFYHSYTDSKPVFERDMLAHPAAAFSEADWVVQESQQFSAMGPGKWSVAFQIKDRRSVAKERSGRKCEQAIPAPDAQLSKPPGLTPRKAIACPDRD